MTAWSTVAFGESEDKTMGVVLLIFTSGLLVGYLSGHFAARRSWAEEQRRAEEYHQAVLAEAEAWKRFTNEVRATARNRTTSEMSEAEKDAWL